MTGRLPTPDELVTALTTAGFEQTGEGRHHLRFRWPTGHRDLSLVVLHDQTAPEYATMVGALLATLDEAERNGQAATAVLDLLSPTRPEVPA